MSKYLTPGLRDEDLGRIAKILGFDRLSISWTESFLSEPIYRQVWHEKGSKTFLTCEAKGLATSDNGSVPGEIVVEHNSSKSRILNSSNSHGVFERILPFPFSFLFATPMSNYTVSLQPEVFAKEVGLLQEQVRGLEKELSRYELSLLWIHDQSDNFPLLFHFVRKKLVRVGTLPEFLELVQKYRNQSLTPANLREFFGTNAAFFSLKVDKFSHLDSPIDVLTKAIRDLRNDPTSCIIGESLVNLETYSPLEFGL